MEDIAKKITALAEKYETYTAKNLSDLIKIKGLSCGEKKVVKKLKSQMKKAGFDKVFIDKMGNCIGQLGHGKTSLCFDGHIDTVDVGLLDNWTKTKPFSGEIKDGYVWGRGTSDQRGGISAFVTAGRILKDLKFDKSKLTIYFVGSTIEEDCDGLCWKYILENKVITPDYVVSTESTCNETTGEPQIYRGHRGRMEINVEFFGTSCHGSAPERGDNAVYKASKFAVEVEKLNEVLKKDEFLGKGTVAISEFVSKSPSLCAVSDYAKIHLDRRLTWGETEESAVKEIEECVKKLGFSLEDKDGKKKDARVFVLDYNVKSYTGLKVGMKKYYPTWKLEEDHPAVTNGVKAYDLLWKKKAPIHRWTFSTNCVAIRGMFDIPCIGFGPGLEKEAHSPNEKVPVKDLVKCSAFYAMYAYCLAEKVANEKK